MMTPDDIRARIDLINRTTDAYRDAIAACIPDDAARAGALATLDYNRAVALNLLCHTASGTTGVGGGVIGGVRP